MAAVITGGFAYASLPQAGSQQNTATNVAFQNNGNSWKHVVAAFDVTQIDGTTKNVYADLWVKPQGTATVDLSSILGYANQALPEGTKVQLQTYTSPISTSQLPQGITDNKVTTTADPSLGGQFLSALTPVVSAADPTVVTPRISVSVTGTTFSITAGGASVSGNTAVPLCANAGGVSAQTPTTGNAVASTPRISAQAPLLGPVVASTPGISIVLPI